LSVTLNRRAAEWSPTEVGILQAPTRWTQETPAGRPCPRSLLRSSFCWEYII